MELTSFSANIHWVGLDLFNSSNIADTFVVTVENLYVALLKMALTDKFTCCSFKQMSKTIGKL